MHTSSKQRIAVIGSGIAGLSAAWLLRQRYEISLFERNDYLGGHTHTIEVEEDDQKIAVDTGFIVYNEPNYPHLTQLFDYMGVDTQDTDMSFAVSIGQGSLEYAGDNLNTLFAQRRNLMSPAFLSMLREILRFNQQCKQLLQQDGFGDISLGDFLDQHAYKNNFRQHYLLPMAAAIWSCPTDAMLAFPVSSFARFFSNHGLLNINHRPQWKTVQGGSWQYIKKMSHDLNARPQTDSPVASVRRQSHAVTVTLANGRSEDFDYVVMASHADESLAMLENPSKQETALLSCFEYQANCAWLHTDTELMPRSRKVWSAWNYLASGNPDASQQSVSVTYWMNRLQRLQAQRDYLVSLNPLHEPRGEHVIAKMQYHHPVFDVAAMQAQSNLQEIQGEDRIWYCGSYHGYGFHEDALRSSVHVARSLGVQPPWHISTQSTTDITKLQQVAGISDLV